MDSTRSDRGGLAPLQQRSDATALETALADYHGLGIAIKAAEERREKLRAQLLGPGGLPRGKSRFGEWDADLTVYPETRVSLDREKAEHDLGISLKPWTTATTIDKTRLTVKPTPAAALVLHG